MYAIEETLSGESRELVRAMWLNLAEPFFGLINRDYTPLHGNEEDHKRKV